MILEESDYLARTIGQVMEEAAKQVDEDFQTIRRDHQKEIDRLQDLVTKQNIDLKALTTKYNSSELSLREAQARTQAIAKANSMLDYDLQRASQTIVDLEIKIESLQTSIQQEQEHSQTCEVKTKELQKLVENNKKYKRQWKQITQSVTNNLQIKIKHLQEKIRNLETECKILKNQFK